MRLLFVTPYFPPEVGAPQTRIHELAVRLARMGHDVRVLTTFPNYPSGVVHPEWRCKARQIGENGRKYVEKHFRREVRARELSSALECLLDGSRRLSTVPYARQESSPTGESFR
jgi:hypothetical protein